METEQTTTTTDNRCRRPAVVTVTVVSATETRTTAGATTLPKRWRTRLLRRWRRRFSSDVLAPPPSPCAAGSCAWSGCFWSGTAAGRTRTRTACRIDRACPGSVSLASSSSWTSVGNADSLEVRWCRRWLAVVVSDTLSEMNKKKNSDRIKYHP